MFKKTLVLLNIFLLTFISSHAQNISGSWWGNLHVGTQEIPLVLRLVPNSTGTVECLLDSPNQGALDIPAQIEHLSPDSINIAIPSINAQLQGRLTQGIIHAHFTQGGFTLPLELKPGRLERRRPQTPRPPFSYQTQEVTFINPMDSTRLAGTLTLPEGYTGKQLAPVVLMVSGSGLQNRNEEIMEHQPFAVIADFLAKQGIASLRYDDRGCAESGGDGNAATTTTFKLDAAAGIRYLQSRKQFSTIGVLGHSEGALIAFMLAAEKIPHFIVSLAAPAIQGDSILAEQLNAQMLQMGMPAHYSVERVRKEIGESQDSPWIKEFIELDPTPYIQQAQVPALVLNGAKDWQVSVSSNLNKIRKILPPNKKSKIIEYPDLNHLFQHAPTGNPSEYGSIEETIAPQVLQDIAQWIHSLQ